jgi:pimeloyl-ACP methyl ester carboxylesterase
MLGAKTPVLLVHGYNGDADAWKASINRFCDSRTWATTFNYGDAHAGSADPSLHWVTDPRVGPALAGAISDLAAKSVAEHGSGKVVVIAHSMGGLALRCALVTSCGRQDLAGKVGAAVTFDTPNTGSFLRGNGSVAESAFVGLLTEAIGAGCFAAENTLGAPATVVEWYTQVCSHLSGMLSGPAATAFTPGSTELGSGYGKGTLPALSGGFPVTSVAGSIRLETTIFYHDLTLGDVGDLVVGEESAFAAANRASATKKTIDCGTLNLSGLDELLPIAGTATHLINGTKTVLPTCWHGAEPTTKPFLDEARRAVDVYTDATRRRPPQADPAHQRTATVTGNDGHHYTATVLAEDRIRNCAAIAHGAEIIAFLTEHPCRSATRRLFTLNLNGRLVAVSCIILLEPGEPPQQPYIYAEQLRALELAPGTGGINDLLASGVRLAGWPESIPSDEVFDVMEQDIGVFILDSWYLTGNTDPHTPELHALLPALYGTPLLSG